MFMLPAVVHGIVQRLGQACLITHQHENKANQKLKPDSIRPPPPPLPPNCPSLAPPAPKKKSSAHFSNPKSDRNSRPPWQPRMARWMALLLARSSLNLTSAGLARMFSTTLRGSKDKDRKTRETGNRD